MATYRRFFIKGYRAIKGEVIVDVRGLVPIIGLNECGKTTILHALLFFDRHRDAAYEGVQLTNLVNLADPSDKLGYVAAEIEASPLELGESFGVAWAAAIEALVNAGHPELSNEVVERHRQATIAVDGPIVVRRRVVDQRYEVDLPAFDDPELNHEFGRALLSYTPWMLYFDDFRMTVPDEIDLRDTATAMTWNSIVKRVFDEAGSGPIECLPDLDPRIRNSKIAAAKNLLNRTLVEQWHNFRLDDGSALELDLHYIPASASTQLPALSISVVERDSNGTEHYFNVADRSKGFYWFFNFVLHLEFNSVRFDDQPQRVVFLLDEPGSYLHSAAQQRLCEKLAQLAGQGAVVIYTTHSQHLLNPDYIPTNKIMIAERGTTLGISLTRLPEVASGGKTIALAMQPVLAALRIPASGFELFGKKCLVVEGISDFYAFRLAVRTTDDHATVIYPSMGAQFLKFIVPVLMAHDASFACLWDNDPAGRRERDTAIEFFGEGFTNRAHLLPLVGKSKNSMLEDLLDPKELEALRNELSLPANSGPKRVLSEAFFAFGADNTRVSSLLPSTIQSLLDVLSGLEL